MRASGKPNCSQASFVDGKILTEMSPTQIGKAVMNSGVLVLKGLFASEAEDLRVLRRAVYEWGQKTEPLPETIPTENCHCLQSGVSRLHITPHVYNSYNFNRISQMPTPLAQQLYAYFKPLCDFQNAITGNTARLEGFADGQTLHPHIIQYPLGGGFFGRHHHPLEPQRIGLVVALSQRGIDYASGGTCFEVNGTVVDLERDHDMGDIALFRFDTPHWVSPSDLEDKFDWNSERGRWTMVLPYY